MTSYSLGPQEGYATSRGFNVHYLEWGEVGDMIVALHSMHMDAHGFDVFSRSMSKDRRIVAVDLLGHGDSDKPTSQVSIEEHMEIVREVVRTRGFTNFTLVGHSIGGFISVVYAAKHPTEVSKLVLVDIAPRDPVERRAMRSRPMPEFFESRGEAESFFRQRYPKFTPEALENRLRYGIEATPDGKLRMKTRAATIDMLRETISLADIRPYVEMIRAPTLLVKGVESETVSQKSIELLENTIKDFSLVEVMGATHMVPQDSPKEFEEAIRDFTG